MEQVDIYERISQMALTAHGTVVHGSLTQQQVLEEVTAAAVRLLDGVDHAGVTLVRRVGKGRRPEYLESTASTGDAPRTFDALQHKHGQGPCFEAIWTHQTVRIEDVETEDRWPRLTRAVVEQTPVRSVLSIQLYTDGQELGALNLLAEGTGRFDPDTEDSALNLATHAAIALSSARRGEQFRSALASRDRIGQAKGIIMERFDVDAIRAFDMLGALSQELNVPVSTLAAQLISRDHPPEPDLPS
nr:GAF and ANTAR domain-containing protein [uncultured Rhodococcus sp.]